MKTIGEFVLALLTTPVIAQEAVGCDWPARTDAIVEPWEKNTATFANGNVRLALLDMIEPAAGAYHILILSPPFDELGGRQHKTLGKGPGIGFAGVEFAAQTVSYEPAVGLVFDLPAGTYDADLGVTVMHGLRFTLNQSTGEIRAEWR